MKTGIHELAGAKTQSKYAACGPGRSPNDCNRQIDYLNWHTEPPKKKNFHFKASPDPIINRPNYKKAYDYVVIKGYYYASKARINSQACLVSM